MTPYGVPLYRHHQTADATYGLLVVPGLRLFTMELPWRDNELRNSCVPSGRYPCVLSESPRFGRQLYLLLQTEPRSGIRIHPANQPHEILGCIAPGLAITRDGGMMRSRDATEMFHAAMREQPFVLDVMYDCPPGADDTAVALLDSYADQYGGVRHITTV